MKQIETNYEPAQIVSGSMGSYLDAPDYPSHSYSIEVDLRKKKENRGGMNIDYALEQDYISPLLKTEIRSLIAKWESEKKPLADPAIQSWIDACITHWGSKEKAAAHIRKFYPEYKGVNS